MTDRQLVKLVRAFRDGILDGGNSARMCAAVCWPLEGYLEFCGITTRAVESKLETTDHIWLLLGDGRVLDPTADQFSDDTTTYPPVYLGPPLWFHRPYDAAAIAQLQAELAQARRPRSPLDILIDRAVGLRD